MTIIIFEILNKIQLKEDLFLLQEKFVKLKEDGPTVVQLMAHQAAKLGAPTKVQMKKASERLSQLMASKPFSRMPYENDFE